MKWAEFAVLLSGLGENTPLARTVSIRLEDDPKILERFTSAQRRVRSEWLAKRAGRVSTQDRDAAVAHFQAMFKNLCS